MILIADGRAYLTEYLGRSEDLNKHRQGSVGIHSVLECTRVTSPTELVVFDLI
jgi:hypothetical protein